jgi:quinohemoprotein ethanol dehydrogenase
MKRWKIHYDTFWSGGTLSCVSNLAFQGTWGGQFIVYRASTGGKLWSFDAGLGIIAAPVTCKVDRTQDVSILVGYGGMVSIGSKTLDYGWRFGEQPRRLLTFAGRQTPLQPGRPPRFTLNAVDDPNLPIDAREAGEGLKGYDAKIR